MHAPAPPDLAATAAQSEVTLDRLAAEWWIYQLRRGHRYNSDDVLTAWFAAATHPGARRLLDLGSGVGAIGLLLLLRLGAEAHLTAVEVQAASTALQRRTIAHNRLAGRVDLRHGDLRDPTALPPGARFDLITANPPYLTPARASRSPHPQRAAARLELHGDVFDYCRAAAGALAAGGRFCFCHRAGDPRAAAAVERAGLAVLGRQPVVFRAGRPPALTLFACGASVGAPPSDTPPLVLRDAAGARTDAYRAVRRAMWIEA